MDSQTISVQQENFAPNEEPMSEDIKDLQKRASKWAEVFFPEREPYLHFIKMTEEVGEVAECFVKTKSNSGDIGEEIADVVICALLLADSLDLNLSNLLDKKMSYNEKHKLPKK